MFDWGAGYTPEWRLHRVNKDTFADEGRVGRVESAGVERVRRNLLESGKVKATVDVGDGFEAGYYRLVMVADQGADTERVEVATLRCESTGGEVDYGSETVEIEGRSVLYPASVRKLLDGTYAPYGADGAAYAAKLLRESCKCPVSAEGSFTLGSPIVFDLGSTYLDAVWKLLDAGGFTMQVDGHGTVHVKPKPTAPALDLGTANAKLLMPSIAYKLDYSKVPNVYYVNDGGVTAQAVNDDPTSATSTVSRGYEQDETDTSPVPVNGETLSAYAVRRLREMSTVEDSRTYTREFVPDVHPNDVVRGSMPDQRLDGDFTITAQSLAIGAGITVKETAVKEVQTWTG